MTAGSQLVDRKRIVLRRLAYLVLLIAWLLVMALPIVAFLLAARGELVIGNEQSGHLRLFMVNSDEAEGIGVQRVKKVGREENCLAGSVRYLLWQGQSEQLNADYCTCFDLDSGYVDASRQCDPG